jgi:uncharacterized membrane protein YraQ (UPF0718 family)
MIKYMGPQSGIKGTLIAFLLGSFAAGPLYGAFPLAAVLMKKGAGFMNILIFIGAWRQRKYRCSFLKWPPLENGSRWRGSP